MTSNDIKVLSFECVDLTGIKSPVITINYSPKDYQEQWVARLHDKDEPQNVILILDSLEELRRDIMKYVPNMLRFDRGMEDDKSLIEVWVS